MFGASVLLAMFLAAFPAAFQGSALSPVPAATTPAVRVEKLTPAELKSLNDARKAVDDAQAKLAEAKRALQGTTEGIEQDHHANTDCGCYVQTEGREYDKVEFKGDSIIIRHIHEAPSSPH